jgi:hypothetical protein
MPKKRSTSRSSRPSRRSGRHERKARFEVTVSREGTMYRGDSKRDAVENFNRYVHANRDYHVTLYDMESDLPSHVVKEHEPMTTLFLTKAGYDKAMRDVETIARYLDREIGFGDTPSAPGGAWINVNSEDPLIIARLVSMLGKRNVREIAPPR